LKIDLVVLVLVGGAIQRIHYKVAEGPVSAAELGTLHRLFAFSAGQEAEKFATAFGQGRNRVVNRPDTDFTQLAGVAGVGTATSDDLRFDRSASGNSHAGLE
jgi:hypothetical protein